MSVQNGSTDLEYLYDVLAVNIDKAGQKSELFLVKLALLLSNQMDEPKRLAELCEAALKDL